MCSTSSPTSAPRPSPAGGQQQQRPVPQSGEITGTGAGHAGQLRGTRRWPTSRPRLATGLPQHRPYGRILCRRLQPMPAVLVDDRCQPTSQRSRTKPRYLILQICRHRGRIGRQCGLVAGATPECKGGPVGSIQPPRLRLQRDAELAVGALTQCASRSARGSTVAVVMSAPPRARFDQRRESAACSQLGQAYLRRGKGFSSYVCLIIALVGHTVERLF